MMTNIQELSGTPVSQVYDLVAEAHARIQRDFKNIDPIVGINRQMRSIGIQADAMTIDCLKSDKRILLVFQDEHPDVASYQFCMRNRDPYDDFEMINITSLTSDQLYSWMKENFSTTI